MVVKCGAEAYKLVPAEDGNLHVAAANGSSASSASFASAEGFVIGDSSSRLLHYFPDDVVQFGASRLRLASWDTLPRSSEFVSLVPFEAEGKKVLVAIDTEGTISHPVVCKVTGEGNKVFLVRDISTAEATLMEAGIREEVTGGTVQKCAVLALTVE